MPNYTGIGVKIDMYRGNQDRDTVLKQCGGSPWFGAAFQPVVFEILSTF